MSLNDFAAVSVPLNDPRPTYPEMIWTEGDYALVFWINGRPHIFEPVHDWDLEFEYHVEWEEFRAKSRAWFQRKADT